MTKTADVPVSTPVRKSVIVGADAATAFRIFTDEIDTWWPRSHHIGKSPMKKAIIEARAGGRCYAEQEDGTECDWGTVTAWEPPHRFAFTWQINPDWTFQARLDKSSEVEVRFTAVGDGRTRVDLEHRSLERHGDGAASMRTSVDGPNGWPVLLRLFAERVDSKTASL